MNNLVRVFEITSTEIWIQSDKWIDRIIEEFEVGSCLVKEPKDWLLKKKSRKK